MASASRITSDPGEAKSLPDCTPITSGSLAHIMDCLIPSCLPPRWKNWTIRVISGFVLISGFSVLVRIGALGLFFLTYLVMWMSLKEVLRLGIQVCRVQDPALIWLGWAMVALFEWYLLGPEFMAVVTPHLPAMAHFVLEVLLRHHQVVVFGAYLTCMVYFVLIIKQSHYLKSYAYFSWLHLAIFFLCLPSHLLNQATMAGLIWYVVPMSVITINDIAAYMVGFFIGRTPLIKLSPKKTREGFIGGAILTLIIGTCFSNWLSTLPSLTCVQTYNPDVSSWLQSGLSIVVPMKPCPASYLFHMEQASVLNWFNFTYTPFWLHGFFISLFASLIGPVGGFFASGFKRACQQKNFGSLIPGHGGVLDRCDCMFLMAIFIYMYQSILLKEGWMDSPDVPQAEDRI